MDVKEWVNMIVNNGTAIGVMVYFALRDWKFMNSLVSTLTAIKEMLKIKEKESEE